MMMWKEIASSITPVMASVLIPAYATKLPGNLIGLDAAGNTQPNGSGVRVSTADSIIGTNGDGVGDGWEFNIISANTSLGIDVTSGGSGTKIAGNTIGLKSGAVAAAGNGMEGILVSGVNNVRIGTNGDGVGDGWEGNNIGANGLHGIRIDTGYGHKISGNIIGVGVNGVVLGNGRSGIQLGPSVYDSTIGTDESNPTYNTSERNIISGNLNSGIDLQGYLVRVAGNYIGTDPGGTADRGNTQDGIRIEGHDNTIGTDGDGNADQYEYNVISGNNNHGILVAETTANNNIISGNIIGLNVSGTLALGNTFSGISLQHEPSGTHIGVGGTSTSDSYERNTISGNGSNGIWISSAQATTICGNYIGVDLTGLNDLGNSLYGIYIESGNDTAITIGVPNGGRSSLGNVISGNNQSGIRIEDADNHIIAGNWIGTNVDVDELIPNGQNGVHILDASNIRIGMDGNGVTDALERNVINGNTQAGVFIEGATSQNNRISRNSFYANGTLAIDLAPAGLTTNDGMDGDSGPNGLQNHPVVRTAFFPSAGQVRILGDFNSTPSSYFSIQFYASLQADPSGSGEGEIFLQEINLLTDASGTAYFDVLIPINLGSSYKYFSTIAIADNLNTSEFGPTVEAVTFPVYLPTILR